MTLPDPNLDAFRIIAWGILIILAAVAAWKDRLVYRKTDKIERELTNNHGGSVKDLAFKAVTLAETLQKTLDQRHEENKKRLDAIEKDSRAIEEKLDNKVEKVEEAVTDLRIRFSRYVVHEARNDLQRSALFAEEEKYLQENKDKVREQHIKDENEKKK